LGFSTIAVIFEIPGETFSEETMPYDAVSSRGMFWTAITLPPFFACTCTICFITGVGRVDEVVGEDHGERLVAHEVARAEHGVAQAQRLGLPHIRAAHARGQEPAHFLQQLRLAVRLQLGLELVGLVEMVLDGALAAAGHEDEVGDAGVHRFFHRVLDERLVDDRAASPWEKPWWPAGIACPAPPRERRLW
jgi:hypothetical protein